MPEHYNFYKHLAVEALSSLQSKSRSVTTDEGEVRLSDRLSPEMPQGNYLPR
jgi:hypothetical protein